MHLRSHLDPGFAGDAVNRLLAHVGRNEQDIDPAVAQCLLQPGTDARADEYGCIHRVVHLDEQIDISATGLVIDAGAKQAHTAVRADHGSNRVPNGQTFRGRQSHATSIGIVCNLGTAARSVRVYSRVGRVSTSAQAPCSSMRPSRMTATRSAMVSTTPMLCVMKR